VLGYKLEDAAMQMMMASIRRWRYGGGQSG
jgi:hypothetical protein